ncbi:MAG: DNA-binding response regulator [Candidatus Aminicenantes bacterium RBG_19FT_COMBO_59_29]|nr:MAG: DNA-binding response regulator [Candidatus Aminicenantes bacterium RBG_19FT_COMBO_59_29]
MKRILIIEDDVSILSGLKDVLTFKSYEVLTAEDGETGYAAAVEEKPDLIILDIMIPKMDGFTLCRKLRAEGNSTPVLMLTAKGEEPDKIRGLDIGADDYVTKPFSLPELLARVRALLRRMPERTPKSPPDSLRIGDVSLNFKKFEATRSDAALSLSPKEFGILGYLASRAGEVVTRDELLDEVWGYDLYPTTRTVDNHIAQLRSKIEKNPADPRYLVTVHGIGYKLVLDEEKR